ncbi:Protein turtle [Orchesella cincta]|uniref:Protein turtle n=1 Tax=Orchesella cincta TaxID=48709 RepID=A0A1D2N307_ORCCI|nr:Protein turtle [Orchesella cincta]
MVWLAGWLLVRLCDIFGGFWLDDDDNVALMARLVVDLKREDEQLLVSLSDAVVNPVTMTHLAQYTEVWWLETGVVEVGMGMIGVLGVPPPDAEYITAIIGESVVFNCHNCRVSDIYRVPYIVQWDKKEEEWEKEGRLPYKD